MFYNKDNNLIERIKCGQSSRLAGNESTFCALIAHEWFTKVLRSLVVLILF